MTMRRFWIRFSIGAISIFLAVAAQAVAPTDEAIARWKANGSFDRMMANWQAFHERGGDSPSQYPPFKPQSFAAKLAAGMTAIDTIRVIVLLVDFTDNPSVPQPIVTTKPMFDSLLFSDSAKHTIVNPTGSMTDYYREVTGGKVYIQGDVVGWLRMPKSYAYYVGGDNGLSKGPELASDAVVAANPTVDFSRYDSNGDLRVDGVILVHPGAGAEETDPPTGIWSHKSQLSPTVVADGVLAYDYTLNPSVFNGGMAAIGVFCHEYGHVMGLPDLYTTNYNPASSQGLGRWSLMASGNYNGNSRSPAHFDAWSKVQLGSLLSGGYSIVDVVDVGSNLYQAAIPQIETTPTVYQIIERVGDMQERWLIENRQQVGFDRGLPGSGLCIYHIDDAVSNNNNYLHYRVGLEQADGRNDLALGSGPSNRGDAGDPWPGTSNNRAFDDFSTPSSRNYRDSAATEVAVWGISNSASVMHANLDVSFSHPRLVFVGADSLRYLDATGGNGNGVPEAGETVDFYCAIRNRMKQSFAWTMTLSCDNPNVSFDISSASQPGPLNPLFSSVVNTNPIRFHLPADFKPSIVNFTLIISSDSVMTSGDRRYGDTLYFTGTFGVPQVMVVDDDNGASFEQMYSNALTGLREPHVVWNKKTAGSPTATDLNKYSVVFWLLGHPTTGGQFSSLDVAALKGFLGQGHGLAITSFNAGGQLHALDSAFLADYLHLRWKVAPPPGIVPIVRGRAGNRIAAGLMYRLGSTPPSFITGDLTPINGGDTAFYPAFNNGFIQPGCTGVTYVGTHRSFFLTLPMEYFVPEPGDTAAGSAPAKQPMDTLIHYVLGFMSASSSLDTGDDPEAALPSGFTLEQNYPNPFNPDTRIEYTLGASATRSPIKTNLSIFNILGQKIVTLVDEAQPMGRHVAIWSGVDQMGRKVSSGVYFYRLERGGEVKSRKMILLK